MKTNIILALLCLVTFTNCTKSDKTTANLKEAIIGETTASSKYAAFAQEAYIQGNEAIAKLFKATSISEAIHAANHKMVLFELGVTFDNSSAPYEVKSTAENLQVALNGENYEVSTMYPQFLAEAISASEVKATQSFQYALDTEKKHQILFTKAIDASKGETINTLSLNYMVCPLCGNTYEKEKVDDKCAFCQTSKDLFVGI